MLYPYSRLLSFRRAGDVKQFASILQPCPTTSRPRHIPTGNIRQRQTDSSHHLSLSKSLRGCGADVSEELSQSAKQPGQPRPSYRQALGRRFARKMAMYPPHSDISGPSDLTLRVPVSESHLPTNCLHKESRRAARSTWSRHHARLLFLAGITE